MPTTSGGPEVLTGWCFIAAMLHRATGAPTRLFRMAGCAARCLTNTLTGAITRAEPNIETFPPGDSSYLQKGWFSAGFALNCGPSLQFKRADEQTGSEISLHRPAAAAQ